MSHLRGMARSPSGRRRSRWLLLGLTLAFAACASDGTTSRFGTGVTEGSTEPRDLAVDPVDPVEATDGEAPANEITGIGEPVATSAPAVAAPLDATARIASIAPAATEFLYELGAGPTVVAVDDLSRFPEQAPRVDFWLNEGDIDLIIATGPDLVVLPYLTDEWVQALDASGIRAHVFDTEVRSIDDGFRELRELGDAIGRPTEAMETEAAMRSQLDATLEPTAPIRVYHEALGEFDEFDNLAMTSGSLVGELHARLGGINVVDGLDGGDFAVVEISSEAIAGLDPQLVVLPTDSLRPGADLASRTGWLTMTAITNGDVVFVEDHQQYFGPRLPELAEQLAAAHDRALANAG